MKTKVIVFTIKIWTSKVYLTQEPIYDIYRDGVWMPPGEYKIEKARERVKKYVQEIKDSAQ